VSTQEIERSLVLPAVVEPDPARLVKVLTPLAGRVVKLNVQLGERVDAEQALAVVDSSDLRTAYAQYDRAKVPFDLARQTPLRPRSRLCRIRSSQGPLGSGPQDARPLSRPRQDRRGGDQGAAAGGSRLRHRRGGASARGCAAAADRRPGRDDEQVADDYGRST